MMKKYNTAAVALALGISEVSIEDKKGMTIAEILTLSENPKLKKYDEEAEKIRQLIADIKELEK
jgi:hypothetical protein